MADDLYTEILGIPAGERPPNYYELLRLDLFTSDAQAIHAAGLRQIQQLRKWHLHTDPEVAATVQQMLNEVSRACTTLETQQKKTPYDTDLAHRLGMSLDDVEGYGELTLDLVHKDCPHCGAVMSQVAVFCIECGYDTRTGSVLASEVRPIPVKESVRIGYVLAEFPSPTETFVANEIQGLIDAGVSVTVFALREGQGDNVPSCPVFYRGHEKDARLACGLPGVARLVGKSFALQHRSPAGLAYALRNVSTALEFAGLARQWSIHHLHAHFAYTPTDIALMMAHLEDFSVSFSAHAWDVYCQQKALAAKVQRADLCIACTEAAQRHIKSLVPDELRDRIVCVHHGTDLDRFTFGPRQEPGEPAHVLAVGRLVPKKGFDVLLYACARLREKLPFQCEIVGDGPLKPKLETLRGDLGLEDTVKFTEAVPYGDMPGVYARADVLAVPSIMAPDGDRDGLPNVVVEAMACGVPVVASSISGIPEAIEDAQTGLLCPPGDSASLAAALLRMLTDAETRSRCVAQARKVVEKDFDAAQNSRKVLDAIKSVAEPKVPAQQ